MVARVVLYAALAGLLMSTNQNAFAQLADYPKMVQAHDSSLIVVQVPDTNEFLAYGAKKGKWTRHTFSPDLTVVPVIGGKVCAFSIRGQGISELAAIDVNGDWSTCRLPMETSADCIPVVGGSLVTYTIDGVTYAFSGKLAKWDSIRSAVPPGLNTDTATIITPDRIAVFSVHTATWAVAELKKK